MGGTEKFRLGAGSQVVRALPVHLLFSTFSILLANSPSRSTLFYDARNIGFSSLHFFPYTHFLSSLLCLDEEIDQVAAVRAASFTRVRTALTGTRVTIVRIAADTHAPRGYPAGTMHRVYVYM